MLYVALVGITLIVVRSTLFERLQRLWPKFFGCPQCFGMWVGMCAGAAGIQTIGCGCARLLDAFLVGGAVSFLSLLADAVLLKLLGEKEETP